MLVFISYAKKQPEKAPKRFLFSWLKKRRLKNRERVRVAATKFIEDFKKTEAGKFYTNDIAHSEETKIELNKGKVGEQELEFIRILDEKNWNSKWNFFKELILYAKEKGANRKVIKHLLAEARKIEQP